MKLIIDTLEAARERASPSDAMALADAIADLLALEQGLEGMPLAELPGAMAAAPDLLAVAVMAHEPYDGFTVDDIRGIYGEEDAALCLALRAAIAKATDQ